ncbi:hypothetical protein FOA52_008752 [Chlamydomonas sp. UWO 241]|nr:hypothetical protein FOA52_008752 [Chlamydomonas sp. UWO 241]
MYKVVSALLSLGVPPDAANKSDVNTALHVAAKTGSVEGRIHLCGVNTALRVAAKAGSVEACRALLDGGADPTKRNGKNRTPCSQPKIPESTKDFLLDKEEAFRKRKEEAKADMYGGKLAETQTQSAFGLRCL